jgi:glycosyltransferase involved in cell wall biosynthesis
VYNGGQYVNGCLQALINQTINDVEIIFVNDGSRDNSKMILDKIARQNKCIKVVHQPNRGPGAARNAGIEIAKGEYIGFVDVDDSPMPTMFEKMYNMASVKQADIVVCGYLDVNKVKETEKCPGFVTGTVLKKQEILEYILKPVLRFGGGMYAPVWNKIYRTSWIKSRNIRIEEDRDYGEDWFFNQLALGRAERIAFIKEPLYRYMRTNPNSITLSYRKDLFELHLKSREFLKQRMEEWGLNTSDDIYHANSRFSEKIFEAIVNEMSVKNRISLYNKYIKIKDMICNREVRSAVENANKNLLTYCLRNKCFLALAAYAWYRAVVKPVLYKIKTGVIH